MDLRNIRIACLTALLVLPSAAGAQKYPSRTVRIVVPGPPSGNTDTLARIVAQKLTILWKRQVIVDNRPGASGMIGTELVAKAAPDGYTFMIGHNGTHAINAALRQKLSYDPISDFVSITRAAIYPNVIVIHPSLPVRSVKDLIALAKSKPGQLSYASSGIGFPQHLSAEVLSSMAGIKMVHVPYKGTAAGMMDTIAGNVTVMFSNLPVALPHINSGRVRAVAVTSLKRAPAAPQIPSVAETALPGYEVLTWYGFLAPAAVPEEIVRQLHADITSVLLDSEVKSIVAGQGGEIVVSSGGEFGAFIKSELNKWAAIIKTSGATAD